MAVKPLKSVAIVAMGRSNSAYVSACAIAGSRRQVAEETWAINAMAGVLDYDRVFMMDTPELFLASNPSWAIWLSENDASKPIYTSHVRTPGRYPGLTDYPLEDVINSIGYSYFNTTVAYAIAYAIHIEVEKIILYGCDFTYPDLKIAEAGRACAEFLLGIAVSRGIHVTIAEGCTLLDTHVPAENKMYGYECPVEITACPTEQKFKVRLVETET